MGSIKNCRTISGLLASIRKGEKASLKIAYLSTEMVEDQPYLIIHHLKGITERITLEEFREVRAYLQDENGVDFLSKIYFEPLAYI